MKAGLSSSWALAPGSQRREPTSDEVAHGFPCGALDRELFNELAFRSSQAWKELENAIVGSGQTPSEGNLSQLLAAMRAEIARYAGSLTLYVSASGNNANSGLTNLAPIQTINEAFLRGAPYRSLIIYTMSDIAITTALPGLSGTQVFIYPDQAIITRNLTFAATAITMDSDGQTRAMRFNGQVDLFMSRINIINQVVDSAVQSVVICGGGAMTFGNLQYSVVSGAAKPLIGAANTLSVALDTVTFSPSSAGGQLLRGVASGVNPNSVWPYRSNAATL